MDSKTNSRIFNSETQLTLFMQCVPDMRMMTDDSNLEVSPLFMDWLKHINININELDSR